MELIKNQTIPLKILSVSSDGNGIGKFDGFTVFVPFSAPGDELLVRIVKVSSSYAFGIIDNIFTPSQSRITPDCDIFGKCGGCAFRHLDYAEELKQKQGFVEDSFLRIAKLKVNVAAILPSPKTDRYRNKVQLPVYAEADSEIRTGFYAGRSHRVVPCTDCMLQPQIFTDISNRLCKLFTEYKISAYNEQTHTGTLRHIFLRYAEKNDNVMVCIVVNGRRLPYDKQIAKRITEAFPCIASFIVNVNKQKTNVILGEKNSTIAGEDYLCDEMSGVPVKLSPLSFYQINTKGAEQLYAVAATFAALSESDLLLDLYCGAGTIGLSMAKDCRELIGVEITPQAIENAKQNAADMGVKNARFICSDASKAAKLLYDEGVRPDVIVLDPPRKGCDEAGLTAICEMAPSKIVMVSCNPSTAARDCAFLVKNGYQIAAIQPVDMFPRTRHIEVVIQMTYCGDKKK